MVVLGGTEGDRLLTGLDEDLILNGGVEKDHTESHRHGHILDSVGDPFLGHLDLDAAKTGGNLIFVVEEGLADSVILGSGVGEGGEAELFCRAAVMVRARYSASRAWAGETAEKRGSSVSR